MADISEFNINNTSYNLKDTEARNNITNLSTDVKNNYLSLSGGTVTGDIKSAYSYVINNQVDPTIVPEEDITGGALSFHDKYDNETSAVYSYQSSDDSIWLINQVERTVNNSNIYNNFGLGIKSDGELIYRIYNPDNFLKALESPQVGDISTTLTININGSASTATKLETPRGLWVRLNTEYDANDLVTFDGSKNVGIPVYNLLGVSHGGTGRSSLSSNAILMGNDTGYVKTISTANGALFATTTDAVASFGTLPIAQGGTGQTAWELKSGISYSSTNYNSGTIYTRKWGCVVEIHCGNNGVTLKTSITTTYKTIATLPYPPNTTRYFTAYTSNRQPIAGYIDTDGKIWLAVTSSSISNPTIYFNVCYLSNGS